MVLYTQLLCHRFFSTRFWTARPAPTTACTFFRPTFAGPSSYLAIAEGVDFLLAALLDIENP
jgi:hypothetical protein